MNDKIDKLVTQLKAADVDARVDAASKLQAEFEAGTEIHDPETLINNFKICLRTANQHLQTAILSALPPLLPLLVTRRLGNTGSTASLGASTSSAASASPAFVDPVTLRQVLNALLASGGAIDRLGDAREKAREKASETIVILGGFAFRCGATGNALSRSRDSKGPETPLMMFERLLREVGLSSKVWRVREQSMLVLVRIRRAHHMFPIRPYLPLLISALEDTDSTVRECARQSVVELFTGPGITDAARTDLKKEMTKKNVRKQIAESVLQRVLSGSTSERAVTPHSDRGGSDTGSDPHPAKDYVPPSMRLVGVSNGRPTSASSNRPAPIGRTVSQPAVRPQSRAAPGPPAVPTPAASEPVQTSSGSEVPVVYIASSKDLETELTSMLSAFEGKETEHNWAPRERAIIRIRGMLKGDVHLRYAETFLAHLKSIIDASFKTLASLRTTVASHTCSLYSELALKLETTLDPYCEPLYTHLSPMAGFTKKIAAQQSQTAFSTIISHTSAHPRTLIPLLLHMMQDKNTQTRSYAVAHVKTYIEVHGSRSKHTVEAAGGHEVLEKCVRRALADPNVGVRESARICFWTFENTWNDRAAAIMRSLDTIAQKQLHKACPNPEGKAVLVPASTPPPAKKSSLAAAIAASRAKAKAIANAPPTLMHQATSASHAMRATSPPLRRADSPSLSNESAGSPRRSSGLMRSPGAGSSQSPPRARVASASTRTMSGPIPLDHSRSASGISVRSPSSPPVDTTTRSPRRTSSAMTSPDRTLQTAAQTALPPSPPNKTLLKMPARTPPRPSISTSMSAPSGMSLAFGAGMEESLLMATKIPIPEDEMEDLEDPTLSTPQQARHPHPPSAPSSQALSLSPPSDGSLRPLFAHSPSGGLVRVLSEPVVEDALRARAEQAESAAERLLELVEPEEDGPHAFTIPQSLLNGSATPKLKQAPGIPGLPRVAAPFTPLNRAASIMKQAAMFQDSPAQNGHSQPLLFNVLDERKHETSWWLKRMSLIQHGTPLKAVETDDRIHELTRYISALEEGEADIAVLQKLALLSVENPCSDSMSPVTSTGSLVDPMSPSPFMGSSRSLPSLFIDMWSKGKNFDRLFRALMNYLESKPSKGESELEYALIVVYELLEHQTSLLDGYESDLFTALLRVRYCNKLNVLEATNAVRDALASRTEPVYGLTTIHASLRAFQAEPVPAGSAPEVKASTYAFGLMALSKFIVRLPAEVLEEELPRLKNTLISALSDSSSLLVRESAAASIIAAQLVLRDEAHLFSLLDDLADEKKNLLTYLFDKHGARGGAGSKDPTGADRLHKEMSRLDTRTSTPPRTSTVTV
ncbi:hypothetical protein PUNSTDRAFT_142631 [Punctularia strigosozonata HHB-11173 SS5]|uniref:uncharacterized protein n=1 Tax=Punctularia strigosozonata (strain HHB-11173) TaxID=741275 RepID=UPI0004416516|nr:uncharacterized protein PUNSTDRAFT_142631 [Punctularia strigosozonata HHB-11173 SS5]EIN10669.1 hypothetical protein PUNSTDRAFT_142631 [Punctularia strigosozonata HHB-11173 SS5]